MKSGDKVKIKSQADIEDTLTDIEDTLTGNYHDYLFFAGDMYRYCDSEVTICRRAHKEQATSNRVWLLSGNTWMWHEDWFHPPIKFLLDEDFDI